MKYISVRLQPALQRTANKEEAFSILLDEGFSPEVVEGNGEGSYINFNIPTSDLKDAWMRIRDSLLERPQFMKSTIVVCEGDSGWDDGLLLHHFDRGERLDNL